MEEVHGMMNSITKYIDKNCSVNCVGLVLSEYKKQVVFYHKKRVFYYKKQKNKKQSKILFFSFF